MEVVEVLQIIGKILPLCRTILGLVSEVRSKKKRCRRLGERVRDLQELVEAIRRGGSGSIRVNSALCKLCRTLTTAQELLRKCTKSSVRNLFRCKKSEFRDVNEELSDAFDVLSGALHVDHRSPERGGVQRHANHGRGDLVPAPYSGAGAPYAGAGAPCAGAMYAAMMEVEDDSLFYAETLVVIQ